MGYTIIFTDDSEYNEFFSEEKGYRQDVVVIADKKKYKVYITDLTRLTQDYELENENGGYWQEPNLIIVKSVNRSEIEKTIDRLYKVGFFDQLGSCT